MPLWRDNPRSQTVLKKSVHLCRAPEAHTSRHGMYTLARLVNTGRTAAGGTSPGSAYGLVSLAPFSINTAFPPSYSPAVTRYEELAAGVPVATLIATNGNRCVQRYGAGANHLPPAGCTAARSSSAATGGSSMPDSKGAAALDAGHQEDTEPLYLPAPEEGATAVLDVSTGATVKLDHLGPLVGTLQRSLFRP